MRDARIERWFEAFRRTGDAAALGRVFDAVAPELASVARYLVRERAEVEDLVQATFLTAIERAGEYDEERALLPWLVGILAKHAARARRASARARGAVGLEAEPAEDPGGDASRGAQAKELAEAMERATAGMQPEQRALLLAYLVDGVRPKELARRLGISGGAARVRVHRALASLRRALPPGLALGLGAGALSKRALGAVRERVLAHAACCGAPAPVLPPLITPLGALLMARRIALALLGSLAVVTLSWLATPGAGTRTDVDAPLALPSALPEERGPSAELAARELEQQPARSAAQVDDWLYRGRVRDAESGAPILGARIALRDLSTGELLLLALSGPEGGFELRAARGSEERWVVRAEGYAGAHVPEGAERRAELFARWSRSVNVAERCTTLLIALDPGLEWSARALREDGAPVAGAEVLGCFEAFGRLALGSEEVLGRSGADGWIRATGLLPRLSPSSGANYVLLALSEEGFGWSAAASGEREAIGPLSIVLRPCASLAVRVLDAEGAPLAGASVSCIPGHPPFAYDYDATLAALLPLPPALDAVLRARTDDAGEARFDRLPRASEQRSANLACRYLVRVELRGKCVAQELLSLDCEQPGELELRVEPEPALRLRGCCRDEEGALLAGVSIALEQGGVLARSDAEGRYELALALESPLRLFLRAELDGYVRDHVKVDRAAFDFRADGHDFVLRRPLSIEGKLIDDLGRPVEGLLVQAVQAREVAAASAPSGADGAFAIPNAGAGEWELRVLSPRSRPEFEWTDRPKLLARGGDLDVRIVMQLRRERGGALEVLVVDAPSGAPLAVLGAALFEVDPAQASRARSPRRELGKVRWEDLPPGEYVAWIASEGRGTGVLSARLEPGASETGLRLEIGERAAVAGRVDFGSLPLPPGVHLSAFLDLPTLAIPGGTEFQGGGKAYDTRPVRADGSFALDGLIPGRWKLILLGEGLSRRTSECTLEAGALLELVLRAEPGATLELALRSRPPEGWLCLETRAEDAPWQLAERWRIASGGSLPRLRTTLDPGRWQWRLRFLETPDLVRARELCEPAEGTALLRAGEVLRVELPVLVRSDR